MNNPFQVLLVVVVVVVVVLWLTNKSFGGVFFSFQ